MKSALLSFSGILLLLSCNHEGEITAVDERREKNWRDSLQCAKVLSAFTEKDGQSWILCDTDTQRIIKFTYLPDYPLFTDTLKKMTANTFASLHYKFEYEIRDKEVLLIFKRKIIHPSSNWQGQTPGQENLVSIYPRRDAVK